MHGGGDCNDGATGFGSTNEIRLAFDRSGTLRILWQIDDGRSGADRIRKGHDRTTMDGLPECAQIWPNQHAGDDAILLRLGECDAFQFGERHFHRVHAFKRCHRGDLRSVTFKRSGERNA